MLLLHDEVRVVELILTRISLIGQAVENQLPIFIVGNDNMEFHGARNVS